DQNLLPSQISSFGNDERIEIDDDDDERIEDDDDKRIEDVDSDDGEKIEDDDDERIEDVDGDDGERIEDDDDERIEDVDGDNGERIEDDDDERIKDGNGDNGERIDEDESIDDDDDFHDGSYIAALDDLNGNNKQETNCIEPLPASTRKGQLYMDTMNIKGLHLKTQDLVEFEGITYKLHYRLIIDAIKSLTSNQELCKEFFLDYKEEWESCDDGTLMQVYSEQNTAEWWHERESPFSKILAVMLYIDGTATTASATLSPQEFRLSHKVIKFVI
ncbi:hypothetical protein RhiirA1_482503, partial [Rhizophagus irregularis]